MINEELISYAEKSVSPYHAASEGAKMLDAAGFTCLAQTSVWKLKPGGKYYTTCFDTTLIAFTVGNEFSAGDDLRIAAAHIDWPCLHIKPQPEITSAGICKLNIEPYGGLIYPTWLDRPLSVAGKLVLKTENAFETKNILINFDEPILTIPNVALHMNGRLNSGYDYNPNSDMPPIIRTIEDGWNKDGYFLSLVADRAGCTKEDIISFDLCVYNAEKGMILGAEKDMISCPRLDNLTSAYACLCGIIDGSRPHGINAVVLYDHEEVGSRTKQGAASTTLTMLLEKAALSLGLDRAAYLDLLMSGTMLSCDVAHAVHPNHPEFADPTCRAFINRGVVLKMNNRQRYPTDADGIGRITSLCKNKDIPCQQFMNRPDLAGGGTIGADASSQLGICTIDCGVPILAMHSARELMGTKDQAALNSLVTALFSV